MMPLAILLLREASAFDTGSNETCTAPEVIASDTSGLGQLSAATDVDAFRIANVARGTCQALVLNRGNPADDFLLEIRNVDGTTVLTSASMSGGLAAVTATVTSPTTLCVRISGSAGEYSLRANFVSVSTYSEMAIGADGVLRVGSISSGVAVVESFDTWNGTRFLAAETLTTSATGRVFGVAVAPDDGNRFAFGVTDNAVTEDDDALVVLTPDGLGRTASTLNVETFASASYPYTARLRDVSWYASGDDVVGAFYGGSGYDRNLGFSNGASTAGTAEVNGCDAPLAIAMDTLHGSGAGWVACGSSVVGVDLSSHSCGTTPCSYLPTTYLYPGVSAITSPSYYPNFLEVAQNGAFLIFGAYYGTGASNTSSVFSVPRSVATAAASLYTGSYDAVGSNFTKPRGAAITPMLSIATPRPGTQIAGIKRLHVIVRDPTVTEVYYSVDGTEVCSDTELADGSAEDCLLNTSAWASGEHVVTVTASGGANGEFEMGATYHAF